MNAPVVILGGGTGFPPCLLITESRVSTLVRLISTDQARGTYQSEVKQRVTSSSDEVERKRKFIHDGVRVVVETSLFTGKLMSLPTTAPTNEPRVWSLVAYFQGYDLTVIAGNVGGNLGAAPLDQAVEAVDSVHPAIPDR